MFSLGALRVHFYGTAFVCDRAVFRHLKGHFHGSLQFVLGQNSAKIVTSYHHLYTKYCSQLSPNAGPLLVSDHFP